MYTLVALKLRKSLLIKRNNQQFYRKQRKVIRDL